MGFLNKLQTSQFLFPFSLPRRPNPLLFLFSKQIQSPPPLPPLSLSKNFTIYTPSPSIHSKPNRIQLPNANPPTPAFLPITGLELFRLEQRYTRRKNRSGFVSDAQYVDGEYVYSSSLGQSAAAAGAGGLDKTHHGAGTQKRGGAGSRRESVRWGKGGAGMSREALPRV